MKIPDKLKTFEMKGVETSSRWAERRSLNDAQMTMLADKTEPIARQALFFRMMPR